MTLAEKLRQLCQRRGLTQAALAREVGVDQKAVSGWLSGSVPRAAALKSLADYFGVRVVDLTDEGIEISEEEAERRERGARLKAQVGEVIAANARVQKDVLALVEEAKAVDREELRPYVRAALAIRNHLETNVREVYDELYQELLKEQVAREVTMGGRLVAGDATEDPRWRSKGVAEGLQRG